MKDIQEAILKEHSRAIKEFKKFNSPHEGIAVIEEEFIELREQVFWGLKKVANNPIIYKDEMAKEAIQLAAMCYRFIDEICDLNNREKP